MQGNNDAGSQGYFGPCPPKGDKPHHYHFQLFAVDVDKLDADENASPAVVGFNLHFHTLAKATLTGIWGRYGAGSGRAPGPARARSAATLSARVAFCGQASSNSGGAPSAASGIDRHRRLAGMGRVAAGGLPRRSIKLTTARAARAAAGKSCAAESRRARLVGAIFPARNSAPWG